jgi:hypothetical protein
VRLGADLDAANDLVGRDIDDCDVIAALDWK